jgi:hypothetical protein
MDMAEAQTQRPKATLHWYVCCGGIAVCPMGRAEQLEDGHLSQNNLDIFRPSDHQNSLEKNPPNSTTC